MERIKKLFVKNKMEYLKFDRIHKKYSKRSDLHAFILLYYLFPINDECIIACAEHNKIFLNIGDEEIERLTEENACLVNSATIFSIKEKEKDKVSYSSVDNVYYPFAFNAMYNQQIQEEERTDKAISVIRTHYSSMLVDSLNKIVQHSDPVQNALPYIQELLKNLSTYKEKYYEDPFSSFISALYDGLVFEDSWTKVDKKNYSKISQLIKSLNNNKHLDYEKIDKCISALEEIGLDTTPY